MAIMVKCVGIGGEKDSFDSKLVRLKVASRSKIYDDAKRFRFQTGSIKRSRSCRLCCSYQSFDSKLVRLKVEQLHALKKQMLGFDSKLVRLKGFMKTINILYATLMGRVKLIF